MKRLKSIDTIRGLSMLWMFLAHLGSWWIMEEHIIVYHLLYAFLDPLGSSAFIFIAGVSTAISYRNRLDKAKFSPEYNKQQIKNEYMIRAFIILGIAIIYNSAVTIGNGDLKWIWAWFVLLTIAISLFLAYPLLATSKMFRIVLSACICVANQIILVLLLPYHGQLNLFGGLFHILYHPLDLDFILGFFPFFLIGTVIGDVIYDFNQIEDQKKRRIILKSKLLYPSIIVGVFLIFFGILFQLRLGNIYGHGHGTYLINFPDFLISKSFSWIIYTVGILLVLLSVLISFEEFELIKTKRSYRFLFYFSYYSLTIYLANNLLYFLFYRQLSVYFIWIYIIITLLLVGLLLRAVYKKWGSKASIKVNIGNLAKKLATRIEERKKIKNLI